MDYIIAIIVFLLIIGAIYLVLMWKISKNIAIFLFTPQEEFCKTKDAVINNYDKEFTANNYLNIKLDYEDFENWKKEYFEINNKGIIILAEFHPLDNSKGCVILAHGFCQNRYTMVPFAKIFRDLGYETVIFDQRYFGESKTRNLTFGVEEAFDVVELIKWVKNKLGPDTQVILHGISMGAGAVMNALQHTDQIDYLIADCGFARAKKAIKYIQSTGVKYPNPFIMRNIYKRAEQLGISIDENNPIEAVRNSDVPICIIHSDMDKIISVENAGEIKSVCKNEKSRLEIFPGLEHGLSIVDIKRYTQIVTEFIKEI